MKLYVASDLHLEFGDLDLVNTDSVDALILSGDILVARDLDRPDDRGDRVRGFVQRCAERFPCVIMVMGNHEHYHGDFTKSADLIRGATAQYSNFHLLDKQSLEIDGWLFLGGTLWTDYNGGDPISMLQAQEAMSDHHQIKNSGVGFYRFLPQHARDDHRVMLEFIRNTIHDRRKSGNRTTQVIVVGHHAPSRQSTHPRYQADWHLNGAYSTELTDFILAHPEIALWTHGHTHEDFDYDIGTTRIVCNPRGYVGYEARAASWQPKLIEL
jgi:Icc-related predicted phosphoesterase